MKKRELVVIKIAGEHYGIPISIVETIERYNRITPVPLAKGYIKGVINLRGNIVPVIDTRKRMGLEPQGPTELTRILVIEARDSNIGFYVDEASEVIELDDDTVESTHAAIEKSTEFIHAIGQYNERLILLLDIDKFLEVGELNK